MEARRLQALDLLNVTSLPDPALDDIVQLVTHVCDVPSAGIALVGLDRVWFKARIGLGAQALPREGSPCDEAIHGDTVFQIADATRDPQCPNGHIAVGQEDYRFYAGAPLLTSTGMAVGTLCIFDTRSRMLTPVEANTLRTLARQIVSHLELNALRAGVVLANQSNSILQAAGDGIVATDLNCLITACNPAAAVMLGYQPHHIPTHILRQNLHALSHGAHPSSAPHTQVECSICNTMHNRQSVRVTTDVFWRKDGTCFPVEYVANPMLEDGVATGMVVAFTDATERHALDRMKDEFVSTVSHELRTPLTSMRASLGLIASGALEKRQDKQQQMLRIAIGNTERLVNLVNDVLDLERIGSGKTQLHPETVDVDAMMHRVADLLSATAVKTGIQFTFAATGIHVWADGDRIFQTLTNLVSNAIKFSPYGGEIQLAAYGSAPGEATLEVRDHGRGIPADKLEMIFGRFQQVDASDARIMGGTGLGLAICRSIVSQHGGRIWAESELGQGARFFVTLPTQPTTHS